MLGKKLLVKVFLISFMAFPGLSSGGETYSWEAIPEEIRAYILHSYESGHVCGAPQGRGIEETLKEAFGGHLLIKRRFMDTKMNKSKPDAMKREGKIVKRDIKSFEPNIVFTIDDHAFREVGLILEGKHYPVVFSGMNAQPQNYNRKIPFLSREGIPDSNITGVYEKLHFLTAIKVMKGVRTELRKITALLDNNSTGKAIRLQMEKELIEGDCDVQVAFRHVGTMKDYQEAIDEINRDPKVQAVYPIVLGLSDEANRGVDFKVTIQEFIRRSKKPGMALNFAFSRRGLFGGASVDFGAMGRQAGRMGVNLLKGADIRKLPIESAQEYLLTFNRARAEMLGITIPDELIGVAIIFDKVDMLASIQ